MKIYEVKAEYYSKPNINPLTKIFVKKHLKEDVIIDVIVHYFEYDHESYSRMGISLAYDVATKDPIYSLNPFCKDIECISFKCKEITFDEVNPNFITTEQQWTRYLRQLHHPDFDWDRYVQLPGYLNLPIGQECSMVSRYVFTKRNKTPSKVEITKINYEFEYDTIDGIGPKTADNIRQYLVDPIFNDVKEAWKFEHIKQEEN